MRRLAPLSASLLLCAGALAGCGGDDDDGSAEGETTTTATVAGGADRLSEAQWQEYQTSAAAFKQANQEAVAKVNACEGRVNVTQFKACIGDALTNVVAASGDLRSTLDGFEGEVGGTCEAARATFSGFLTNYEATATSLDRTLNSGNSTGFSAGVQNIKTVAAAGAPARDAFESSCGPA